MDRLIHFCQLNSPILHQFLLLQDSQYLRRLSAAVPDWLPKMRTSNQDSRHFLTKLHFVHCFPMVTDAEDLAPKAAPEMKEAAPEAKEAAPVVKEAAPEDEEESAPEDEEEDEEVAENR